MTPLGHWALTIICGILGFFDILMFVKTPKAERTRLHWVVLVCGSIVLIMAIIQTVSLLTRGRPV